MNERSQVVSRTVTQLTVALGFLIAITTAYAIRSLLVLVLVSVVIALGAEPMVQFLQRSGLRNRAMASGAALTVIAAIFAAIGLVLLPPLISQTVSFVSNLPNLVLDISRTTEIQHFSQQYNLQDNAKQLSNSLPQLVTRSTGLLLSTASTALGIFTDVVVVITMVFFLLLEGPGLWKAAQKHEFLGKPERAERLGKRIQSAVGGYITGNLFISLIAGTVAWIIMTVLHVPYALPLAVVVALLDLVPLVGAQLAAFIVALVALSQGWFPAVMSLVLINVYQIIENNYIQPIVYGRTVQLSPLIVFLAALAGAQLYGLVGVLLAIPVTAALQIVFLEWVEHRKEKSAS